MNLYTRRLLGKVLITLSFIFLIAALFTFFSYSKKEGFSLPPRFDMPPEERQQYSNPQFAEGARLPNPLMYDWPYRWLSTPLLIVGIFLFFTGLLIGYRDDISEVL